VSKLKRLSYGPYKIGSLQPGSIVPLDIKEEIKEKFYMHLRHKIQDFSEEKRT
jgi:16S rRNA U516 pseudouridylate synthase RsuA-like enzyme